jgi:hypothetical protein
MTTASASAACCRCCIASGRPAAATADGLYHDATRAGWLHPGIIQVCRRSDEDLNFGSLRSILNLNRICGEEMNSSADVNRSIGPCNGRCADLSSGQFRSGCHIDESAGAVRRSIVKLFGDGSQIGIRNGTTFS